MGETLCQRIRGLRQGKTQAGSDSSFRAGAPDPSREPVARKAKETEDQARAHFVSAAAHAGYLTRHRCASNRPSHWLTEKAATEGRLVNRTVLRMRKESNVLHWRVLLVDSLRSEGK